MTLNKLASLLISLIAIVYILIVGQSILVPLVFAVILWILVRELKSVMDKIGFVRNKFPSWLKTLIAGGFMLGTLGLVSQILVASTRSLTKSYAEYKQNVQVLAKNVRGMVDIDINEFLTEQLSGLDFASIFSALLNSLTDLLGSTVMIVIYALFIFLEEGNFGKKLRLLYPDKDKYDNALKMLNRIEDSVNQYLGLKILVSLLTGLLSFVALKIIGIDGPAFWAFLIFLLNFIPTIGSLIATLFPAIFSLIQFGEFLPGLMILLFVGGIQLLVGNIIEPKVMGNSLNMSSLVAIVALVFWGAIWGVTGMLLSIPITVIIIIILSNFPSTRGVAILLSESGNLKNDELS